MRRVRLHPSMRGMAFLYFIYLDLMGPPFEDSCGIFLTKLCDDSRLILTIHSN